MISPVVGVAMLLTPINSLAQNDNKLTANLSGGLEQEICTHSSDWNSEICMDVRKGQKQQKEVVEFSISQGYWISSDNPHLNSYDISTGDLDGNKYSISKENFEILYPELRYLSND